MAAAGRPGRLAAALEAADAGDRLRALSEVSEPLASAPDDAEANFVFGLILLETGDPAGAARVLRRALHYDPSLGLAAFTLGRACDRLGDPAAARAAYQHALRVLDPADQRHELILQQIDVPGRCGGVPRPARGDIVKILIAEDSSTVRRVVAGRLAADGYQVVEAVDGEDALKLARQERPDLIVLDKVMPKYDGFEVLRALREDPEMWAIPIVMLTERASEPDVISGLGLGVEEYMAKPFSPRELSARVQRVLARAGHVCGFWLRPSWPRPGAGVLICGASGSGRGAAPDPAGEGLPAARRGRTRPGPGGHGDAHPGPAGERDEFLAMARGARPTCAARNATGWRRLRLRLGYTEHVMRRLRARPPRSPPRRRDTRPAGHPAGRARGHGRACRPGPAARITCAVTLAETGSADVLPSALAVAARDVAAAPGRAACVVLAVAQRRPDALAPLLRAARPRPSGGSPSPWPPTSGWPSCPGCCWPAWTARTSWPPRPRTGWAGSASSVPPARWPGWPPTAAAASRPARRPPKRSARWATRTAASCWPSCWPP